MSPLCNSRPIAMHAGMRFSIDEESETGEWTACELVDEREFSWHYGHPATPKRVDQKFGELLDAGEGPLWDAWYAACDRFAKERRHDTV